MTTGESICNQEVKKDHAFVLCYLKSIQRYFITILDNILIKMYAFYQNFFARTILYLDGAILCEDVSLWLVIKYYLLDLKVSLLDKSDVLTSF